MMNGLENATTRAWHLARRPLTSRRAVYMALNRLRSSRAELLVRPDSSLLIEAPMRSGNTYAVAAFLYANGEDHHVARHLHAPAHVLQGLKLVVPSMILLRDPVEACSSHVIRRPALRLEDSLRDYVLFYETLETVADDLTVVAFETLIRDFGSAIRSVNARHGTGFEPYENTPRNESAVRRLVERMHLEEPASGDDVDEMRVARPSSERSERKTRLIEELDCPRLRPLAEEAAAIREVWGRRAKAEVG